jgi:hypothetical protein
VQLEIQACARTESATDTFSSLRGREEFAYCFVRMPVMGVQETLGLTTDPN